MFLVLDKFTITSIHSVVNLFPLFYSEKKATVLAAYRLSCLFLSTCFSYYSYFNRTWILHRLFDFFFDISRGVTAIFNKFLSYVLCRIDNYLFNYLYPISIFVPFSFFSALPRSFFGANLPEIV